MSTTGPEGILVGPFGVDPHGGIVPSTTVQGCDVSTVKDFETLSSY